MTRIGNGEIIDILGCVEFMRVFPSEEYESVYPKDEGDGLSQTTGYVSC